MEEKLQIVATGDDPHAREIDATTHGQDTASTITQFQRTVPNMQSRDDSSPAGMIELHPLNRRDLNPPPADQPWEVDSQLLRRLRDTSQPRALPPRVTLPQQADAVIATWFGNQTGLIELERGGELPESLDLSDALVDVVLRATVGLHRHVELMASAESPMISEETCGVVMAAIANEQQPISSPIAGQTPVWLSSLAYPAAAISAGLTLAVGRKREAGKRATQESTDVD